MKKFLAACIGLVVSAVGSQVFALGGTWEARNPMPTARYHVRAGVVNSILYVMGGCCALRTVEAYDPVTNTWTTKAPMLTARMDPAVGVVNGIMYVAGGSFGCCDALANVEAYHPLTDTWTRKARMPTARRDPAAGVVNGIIYVVGGFNGAALNTVEAYDPVTDTWTRKTPMPTARADPTVDVVNGILYAVGGWIDLCGCTPGLDTVEAYDPVTDTWTTKTPIPTPRFHHASGVVDGIIYVVGGWSGTAPLDTVEAYDPVTNSWSEEDPMPTARRSLAAGVVDGILYAVGGFTGSTVLAINEAFIPIHNVAIDIKPGSDSNPINPRSKGKIPVAILTTDTFDATAVEPTTVRFGPNGTEAAPVRSALEDVDGDGDTDMILHFKTQDTGIVCGDTSASLTGETFGGQAIEGSDSIKTVGCK